MKKVLSVVFACVLILSVLILPVLASEEGVFTCPRCGESAYQSWVDGSSTEEQVVSCDKYLQSHIHKHTTYWTKAYCSYCLYTFVADVDYHLECILGVR